jgi:hypothetical protein
MPAIYVHGNFNPEFVHIPKTAGTSIGNCINNHAQWPHRRLFGHKIIKYLNLILKLVDMNFNQHIRNTLMFFIKPSVVTLDCFTNRSDVLEYFPVDSMMKFLPGWWKQLPAHIDSPNAPHQEPTMKSCVGFNSFHRLGIAMPLWTDFGFVKFTNGDYQYHFADNQTQVDQHVFDQMQGFLDPANYAHLKILSPWLFVTKQDLQWSWVQNTWGLKDLTSVSIPPAIVDFRYNNFTHINMFVNLKNPGNKFMLESGTPLVNLIPLTDKKIIIHNHYDPDKFQRLREHGTRFSYTNVYAKRRRIMQKRSGCPLGF